MGIGSCYSCIKYLMFAFNFLFWLLGCVILGVGIWIRVDPDFREYVDTTDAYNMLYTGAYIFMAIGAIIMVVGFLGCCGAIRESQCMLVAFFLFLLLILIGFVAVGVLYLIPLVFERDKSNNQLLMTLKDYVDNYSSNPDKAAIMDKIQENFKCCGYKEGFGEYKEQDTPASCGKGTLGDGCGPKIFEYIEAHFVVIAGVAIGIAIIMILGMIFSMLLCCAIRQAVA